MALYGIEFAPAAYRQFAKLEPEARRRLAPHIEALSLEPRPAAAKRLETRGSLYRLRVGAWRIVYSVEDDRLVVLVVKLGHRRDVYRRL